MGIRCGAPLCETDPVTNRINYFGPIVNRSSRIVGSAAGGHIMCSSDVTREINAKIFETERGHRRHSALGPVVVPVGEVRLKGLEVPEVLSLVFPSNLFGRKDLDDTAVNPTDSRVQFSMAQMWEQPMLTGMERLLQREPPGQQAELEDFQVKRKQTRNEVSAKRSEELRPKDDDFLDDPEISPVDALLRTQQLQAALLDQGLPPPPPLTRIYKTRPA
ncbi:hypothetical protein B0H11DRAFT_2244099 [Mycena galericulata]|nr:hypothetical protein B0H11DRAFT_2244099 [Mycena galericulata]